MLIPPQFALTEPEALHRIIQDHPLGMLVTQTACEMEADHLPFEFDPTAGELGKLTAHVDRANPVWQHPADGSDVLIVFRGNEGYISPSWYPSKHETHRAVPTWNYEVVHVRGRLNIRDDEKFVRGMVARLTRRHESKESNPWKMGDSAPGFITDMLKKIVGLEILISELRGMSKMSQNRESRDLQGAIEGLRLRDNMTLAGCMEKPLRSRVCD